MSVPLAIPKPNRVLSPIKFFVDRGDEISTIVNILKGDSDNLASDKRCVVSGYLGIGKTELCRAVANQLSQEFPEAQIYLQMNENDSHEVSLFKIYETVIHIFDPVAPVSDDPKALYNQYLAVLDGKKVLIILEDVQPEQLLELLIPPPSCALLATTNERLENANGNIVTLGELSQENAENLLKTTCRRVGKHATRLSNLCKNLPLNLCLAAGYLNLDQKIKIEELIIELEDAPKLPKQHDESITSILLNLIFDQFSATERNFFSQLGIFQDGFSEDLARELKDFILTEEYSSEKTIQTYLDIYTQLNLLIYDEANKYYRMHPIIQNYALENLGKSPEIWYRFGKAFTNSLDWLNTHGKKGADGYMLFISIFDDYKSTIKHTLQFLLKHKSVESDQLLLEFRDLICLSGRSRFASKIEMIPLLEAMMEASIRLQNKDKLILILSDISNTYQILGEAEKALYYSKLQDEVIHNDQNGNIKMVLENISHDINEHKQVTGTDEETLSNLMSSVLEELSINKTKIILTGFMGTGKTTVGKLLAENLNYRFIDTDELIESRNERSIADIFNEFGEEAFREMERAIVKEIAELDGIVVSTGGRLMLDPENAIALSRNSRVLCLVATPDEILTRVTDDTAHKRPLLSVPNPKERIVELLQERKDKYLRFPQIVTDEKKPQDIASGIVEFVSTSPRSLVVENPQKSYEYIVGAGLLPFVRQLTGIEGEIVIITDEFVKAQYGPSCSSMGHIVALPSGRQNKSLKVVEHVYNQLIDKGFDRSGTIVALGGSVIGDIAGYVAATYMRGVNFIQCPTSLIAMVDTSVGGKTGIDLPQGKSIIGVYKQPAKVIADVATLQTLPQLDFASGMAEVIKHGLVAESNLLEQVEQGHWAKNWDRSPSYIGELQRLVAQAIQVKINIVQADPFEQGQRSILNLGHTFAYAIEQVSKDAYRHGEAVGLGLIAAANLSARLGLCDSSLQERIVSILESVKLPTRIPSNLKPIDLLQAMQRDKKKQAGQLRFILIRGIGQVIVSDKVSDQDVLETISSLSK